MILTQRLSLSELHLRFEYNVPQKRVFQWWTDLSGSGYVGKALKSINPVGREGESTLVETRWTILGMTKTLLERLTLLSEDQWVWQPTIFGIEITDTFRLTSADGKTTLTIDSESKPKGMRGKLAQAMFGRMLDKMMVIEWNSASDALASEMEGARSAQNV